ncbi:unnamed protein product [Acanthoscelides obtectus]|uniref:Uncharacterized protein n=1 Tax=Acanthoscelides obtectus TaxID=200917 RepID=A0A9P0P7H3_ACAOB|nr:unnamed protein product [Acanthoscelides obtectus]CAK1648204.1 hypothetical protein AOBTE_LOCUS15603 [Acanthoscelides obtectus]
MPLVEVILPKMGKSQQVFNEHELLGLSIRVEVQKNSRLIGQCHRCQKYGHAQSYCTAPPKSTELKICTNIGDGIGKYGKNCQKPRLSISSTLNGEESLSVGEPQSSAVGELINEARSSCIVERPLSPMSVDKQEASGIQDDFNSPRNHLVLKTVASRKRSGGVQTA